MCFLKDKKFMQMVENLEDTEKSSVWKRTTVEMRMFYNLLFPKYFEIFCAVQL